MSIIAVGISVDEAERITEQIVGRIDSISENVDAVMSLMREALSRNAHDALGYASPGAYISDRFGSALSGLSASLRREFVHELSEAGMSTRAIAPVFGVSQKTIVTDRQVIPRVSPEPEAMRPDEVAALMSGGFIDSVDQVAELIEADPATGEVIEPTVTEHTVTEKVKTVQGLDGKTYTKPVPKPREVPTGDAAERLNAETMSKDLGRALMSLSGMKYPEHRARLIERWLPAGNDAVPSDWKALIEPNAIREIAGWLLAFADDLKGSRA